MKKRTLTWLGVTALILGIIFTSCENDNDKTKNITTGIHKIVVEQTGDTEEFELSTVFGAASTHGIARLYNENGEYLGDSYSINKVVKDKIICQTDKEAYMLTCAGSISSTTEQIGKKIKITVIAYIDNKEVNRLEKEYTTNGNTLYESFSVSAQSLK